MKNGAHLPFELPTLLCILRSLRSKHMPTSDTRSSSSDANFPEPTTWTLTNLTTRSYEWERRNYRDKALKTSLPAWRNASRWRQDGSTPISAWPNAMTVRRGNSRVFLGFSRFVPPECHAFFRPEPVRRLPSFQANCAALHARHALRRGICWVCTTVAPLRLFRPRNLG